ncbi:MAG: radical SAM family heme chaperone HemW [Tannerella sp.]|nr:radical SAM family heme chaperone HemW [Tannerella sp.]
MAGIYIHVPFCSRRCIYCDFFSQTEMRYKSDFVQAIVGELSLRRTYLGGEAIETIYFGGGTPSLLQAADFERIFNAIRTHHNVLPDAEITLEANPDDLNDAYVSALQPLPFNRISLGVQSFRDDDLQLLNRRHNCHQVMNAVSLCREYGYENLSIDLIYGLPGQTPERWKENLEMALRLDVPHLSAYHLSCEENTPLYRQLQHGVVRPVDERVSVRFFHTLIYMLAAAGYLHYEISNFCKPGCFSRHNSSCWTGGKYLGVGPSAHSFDHVSRQWNIASLPEYLRGITCGTPVFEKETLDLQTRYNEYVMTRLRTMWGIRLSALRETFGMDFAAYFLRQVQPHIRHGLIRQTDETFGLTPQGAFVSDGILSDLMSI